VVNNLPQFRQWRRRQVCAPDLVVRELKISVMDWRQNGHFMTICCHITGKTASG
jgi:hypothetical protein